MTKKLSQNIKMTRALVQKQIQKSFHRSIFGVAWHLVIPTFQLIIFLSLYGAINNEFDLIATIIGLTIWQLFSNSIFPSLQQVIGSKGLITNVKVPFHLIPASSVVMSAIFVMLFLTSATFFVFYYQIDLHSGLFASALITLIFLAFVYGVSIIVSIGNVFFRDVGMLWNSFSFLIFLTAPILYPEKILPEPLSSLSSYNPISIFIHSARESANMSFFNALSSTNWLLIITISVLTLVLSAGLNRLVKNDLIANL